MTQGLAVRDEGILTLPSKQDTDANIERATYVADKLAEIVESRGWYATIQGKRYLEVEAWQFVGFQAGVDADIEFTEPVYDGEEIIAYRSKAILTRNGVPFSSGIMECGMDSFPTQGKLGRDKHKAAQSASQTWAVSKAYRNRLSFIAKMAGFEATPADEMRFDPISEGDMNVCPHHSVSWFKSGKMRDEAHPVEGQTGPKGGKVWCNKANVLRDLDDVLRAIATDGQWDRTILDETIRGEYGKGWSQLSPSQKLDTIGVLQRGATLKAEIAPETTEVIGEPY